MQTKIKRISFTSDGKRKSNQITLRNLLPDHLIQNNFTSLQSQRLTIAIRPQTMYNDRIKKKLYPQSAMQPKKSAQFRLINTHQQNRYQRTHQQKRYLSTHQQNRLTRNKSENIQQITPTRKQSIQKQYNSNRGIFVSKEQKTRMKKCLGKVNLLSRDELKLNQNQQLQVILQFMQCLSKNENYYQEAFQYMNHKFQSFIYMDLDGLVKQSQLGFRKIAQITNNKTIISSIFNNKSQKITFKELVQQYANQIITIAEKSHQQQQSKNIQISQLRQTIKQKQQLIHKLTQKLSFYQSHPSQNKYPLLIELKQQNHHLKQQIQQQLYKIRVLNHNLQLLHQTKLMNQNKIQTLKKQIINYQLEKQSNLNKVEKSSELKQFQDNVTMLKQMLDRSIIRMGGMKEEYDKLKNYNQSLIEQRDNLARRAAVGFGQLTPRPNLKKIFQNYNMNFNQVFDQAENSKSQSPSKKQNKKLISTQKFVDTLIGKFKNYYQTYKLQQKQKNQQLNSKKKKNTKQKQKQKQKDVFDKVLDEVYQAKNHIKKTVQSAQQVKMAYNRKQQQILKK